MNLVEFIKDEILVAVIREANPHTILPIAEALYEGGVKVLEITAETPKFTRLIEIVRDEMDGRVLTGAGTVLDPETARAAIMAGSEFIVSPSLNLDTVKMTKRYGIPSIPGALTPTEILTAFEHGADMIKVFPANTFGPGFVKSIHGPFPSIPLMVTGGINMDNLAEYLEAGALAVGLGGNLVNSKQLQHAEDYQRLTQKAREYARIVQKVKAVQAT
ncbi:bifunctional 4-hydroxy-2-oxoglutarate aldolase/2-dehydro-3-deoxy-phosphogluconate aldolase [Bacillus sp. KH172YL63]|uniref:bifunctional 4-hydroxy-2-oxoglutarate aldolase/2-dehydro-3-deoxy-phosphogluconate aldolase n=1 Tax=Bacillus sp. KH172YL63 TaxID=2709784 RepID=UPI0013E46E2F|nr:bifunctional 4-hydroxy-2-oxoglutarate aldolase/2-dehydro-3-deoxy-phosphogluconate aldolase [Bacillus sp. KH172YL63]BCB05194.1 2-dehydro-3-deoxy-phosphogluconate aldolase [Bacillus sp. KH172YL63]